MLSSFWIETPKWQSRILRTKGKINYRIRALRKL